MKVSELGEFGLIDLLAEIAGATAGESLLIGIGDDAACWRTAAGLQLATSDSLVQGVHFTLEDTTWQELGWKALAVNLSDIAAMGGTPQHALVSLGLPPHTEVEGVTGLYRGMAELARYHGVSIAGGDMVEAPVVVINLSLIGAAAAEDGIMTRSAAARGDRIAVSGSLGASAAWLAMAGRGLDPDGESAAALRKAHLHPEPRVAEGQALARLGVKAAIDISDGLLADLGQICRASGVGARLLAAEVPIHPAVKEHFGHDALGLALGGGEDYELLFTADEATMERVKLELACPLTVIGEIVERPQRVAVLDDSGNELNIEGRGWEHFGRGKSL